MSLTIGTLDTLVCIEQRDDTYVQGSTLEGWRPYLDEVWASVVDLSAREFIGAQAAQSMVTTKITMRWTPLIDASMRVRRIRDGQIYAIAGPPMEDNQGGRRWLTLMCVRGVNRG